MKNKYDFLIVGAGLYGSVCARQLTDKGYKCFVIDKRDHIGGNCYSEKIENINVHKYGPHVFHTDNDKIWSYINKFSEFNNYNHRIKVNYNDKLYSFPINLFTLYQIFGIKTPEEARLLLQEKRIPIPNNDQSLENWVLSIIGKELYEIFIKGYTKKQWNTDPKYLPADIIKRVPIRLNFEDNLFSNGKHQGIPIGGYNSLFENILSGITVELNCVGKNFNYAKNIIYTGKIDEFFDYKYGELEYRSLRFEQEIYKIKDYQGCSVINYTAENIPYTRVIEHKHFENSDSESTVITKEYPSSIGDPCYPINNSKNIQIYKKYIKLSRNIEGLYFGGRLGLYSYLDMDKIIEHAISFTDKF
jgi:UDP-galactopyranose mutase